MIHSFDYCLKHIGEVGEVASSGEYLVTVSGLPGAVVGEGVTFEGDTHGRVMTIREDGLDVLVFSREPIATGTRVARTGSPLLVSCGDGLLSQTITTLGHAVSSHRAPSHPPEARAIEEGPVGIAGRAKISRFFPTGTSVVDTLIPLGYGQRELVIGDRKTGKTHFLIETVLTQARLGTVVVYCAIGKRKTEIKRIEEFLRILGVLPQCVIVAADSYESPANIMYAPYTAITIAEYFRDTGRDSLVVLDDLTTHAKSYREVTLLSGIFPGRESYPGDIFAIHSSILERAGCFIKNQNNVAITCLPVVESVGGDLTGYIQTNVMSMTDGHIFFDSELFAIGRRPAVNVFLSVTRVGRQTQTPLLRDMNTQLVGLLKSYDNAQRYIRFGSEMTDEMKRVVARGDALWRFFSQTGYDGVRVSVQAFLVALLWMGRWDGTEAKSFSRELIKGLGRKLDGVVQDASSLAELVGKIEKLMPEKI